MGEAKFTPGEWGIAGDTTALTGPTTVFGFRGICAGDKDWPTKEIHCGMETIAVVIAPESSPHAPVGESNRPPDVALLLAHARLIAAAPDLYAALVEAADAIEGLIDGEKCEHAVNICWCGQRTVLESAQAAIRKATEPADA